MFDGRVGALRQALEAVGGGRVIMALGQVRSAFYCPYREAIGSANALQFAKKTYQMDPATPPMPPRVALDIGEGADMVRVKRACLPRHVRRSSRPSPCPLRLPVAGEYGLSAAAQNGWIEQDRASCVLTPSARRCTGIITYFAPRGGFAGGLSPRPFHVTSACPEDPSCRTKRAQERRARYQRFA